MNPLLFALNNLLEEGAYVPGEFIYPQNVALKSGVITAIPPALRDVVLTLEIGGRLTAITVRIPASNDPEFTLQFPVNITVPANSLIRWQATSAPAIATEEGAATKLSITMEAEPGGTIATLPLAVVWVNGPQRADLYAFDPATLTFNDISNGLSATTATITNADNLNLFSIKFQGTEALRVEGGSLRVNSLNGMLGVTPPLSAGGFLEFSVGLTRVATLTADGALRVPSAAQGSLPPPLNTFILKEGNASVVSIGLTGLVSLGFQEPL